MRPIRIVLPEAPDYIEASDRSIKFIFASGETAEITKPDGTVVFVDWEGDGTPKKITIHDKTPRPQFAKIRFDTIEESSGTPSITKAVVMCGEPGCKKKAIVSPPARCEDHGGEELIIYDNPPGPWRGMEPIRKKDG